MKATIIIPNINGKGWLKDSIESVYAQTEQDFELIVVDNGSTDESLEQARSYCSRPNFQLIENGSNTGFSHAVNQGIARAKSEFVVLFNNDAFAEPQWLAELIRVAESDEKIFAVQSLMIRHFDRELADDAGDYVTWMGFACKTGDGRRASRYTKQKRIFSACGGAALYRKSILDEIGVFDENFFAYFEDGMTRWSGYLPSVWTGRLVGTWTPSMTFSGAVLGGMSMASPSASSGWPMKKASAISEKRLWTPLQKSFWIRTIPGTTVPWNGFDQTEKEESLWDLTFTPGR